MSGFQQRTVDSGNRAIPYGDQIGEFARESPFDTLDSLIQLALRSLERYEETGSLNDITSAISLHEKTLVLMTEDHPGRIAILNDFSQALRIRAQRFTAIEDLNRAIESGEQAIRLTRSDDSEATVTVLENLGDALSNRFDWTGSLNDLNRVIDVMEQAVSLSSKENPKYSIRLINLSDGLHSRFERTGCEDDIDRALLTSEKAIES